MTEWLKYNSLKEKVLMKWEPAASFLPTCSKRMTSRFARLPARHRETDKGKK